MKLYVLILFLSGVLYSGYSQQNPFRRPASVAEDTGGATTDCQKNGTPAAPRLKGTRGWKYIPFRRELLSAQRTFSGRLSGTLRAIKTHPSPSTVALLLFVAFLYGVLHSMGPGHAKTLFISHGLTRASPPRDTWIAGGVFSLTHTGSALLLFIAVKMLLGWKLAQQDDVSRQMAVVSGLLIIVAGLIITVSSLLEKRSHVVAGKILSHASGLIPIAVIAGLAPCPGVFLILTFSTIIGILPVGVAAVVAVSAGMAITVSLAGMVGSSIGKNVAGRSSHRMWHVVGTVIRYCAAGVIIVIGLLIVSG